MLCLVSARPTLRPLYHSFSSSIATFTHRSPYRALTILAHSHNDLFDYTSGRWIVNDARRHAERRRVFNVDGLCHLAAQSVNRDLEDIAYLEKLDEGEFNRAFLITMHDGFQMVARIPYPVMAAKYLVIASEVATMALLRSCGLPIPQIYGYSPVPSNAAETEYIFMEFIQGTKLGDIWFDLNEGEIMWVLHQLAELESKMMSISFPAGGSLYYTKDLEKMSGGPSIPLEDGRFCIGPDTRLPMWFGKRSQLNVDRGPYESAEKVLIKGAEKELTYLRKFGRPLLPFNPMRREAYKFQEQSPLHHIANLERYLLIAPSLVPRNPALRRFSICHPDLQPDNIILSKSPNSDLPTVSLVDWQHTSILPTFLLVNMPKHFENYGDPVSESMTRPLLSENLDETTNQDYEEELHRRRLVHYYYIKIMEEYNPLHHAVLTSPIGVLRRCLFTSSSDPWKGENLALKVALIKAVENWGELTEEGALCPLMFDPEEVYETTKLDDEQRFSDKVSKSAQDAICFKQDGWVPTEHYEEAMARIEQIKEHVQLEPLTSQERAHIMGHWLWEDFDEDMYM